MMTSCHRSSPEYCLCRSHSGGAYTLVPSYSVYSAGEAEDAEDAGAQLPLPKSMSLAVPVSRSIRTFSSLTSPWRTWRSRHRSTASTTCRPIRGEYCRHVTRSPPITAHLAEDLPGHVLGQGPGGGDEVEEVDGAGLGLHHDVVTVAGLHVVQQPHHARHIAHLHTIFLLRSKIFSVKEQRT